jgi:RNA polymerase sigma factor (sigma-70 family)
MQETFLRVFQRLDQFRGDGPFDAWVRRVAVTTCLDQFRADAPRWQVQQPLEAAAELTTDDADALSTLNQEDVLRLVARLPDGYRLVINLYCLEGYSHKEIGQQLGIDERTSSSQLFKARRLLAEWVRRAELIPHSTDDFA